MTGLRKSSATYFFAFSFLYVLASYALIAIFDDQTMEILTRENYLYESSGALYLFLASACSLFLFIKTKSGNSLGFLKTKKNYLFLALAFLFFFAFGEEISWGQQIFHWRTPEYFEEHNVQDETNIHNLRLLNDPPDAAGNKSVWRLTLNFNRLMSLLGITFGLLIPAAAKISQKFASRLKKVGIPIVPLWLGALFVLSYILLKYAQTNAASSLLKSRYVEIDESVFSFLFFILTVWWIKNIAQSSDQGERGPIRDSGV